MTHRRIVMRGFQISGWLLGVPAILMALVMGIGAFVIGSAPTARPPEYLSVATYGIVGLISNAATGLGGVLSFLNGFVAGILGLFAVLALATALFAVLLGLIGRGLSRSARWARPMAGAVLIILSLNSLLALTVLKGEAWFADGVVLVALLYGLWVLVWRFEDSGTA
jgi:hypothetical protein